MTNRAQPAERITEQEAYEIGVEAYTYLYPLVLMDLTRQLAVNVESGKVVGRGPWLESFEAFNNSPIVPDRRSKPPPRR